MKIEFDHVSFTYEKEIPVIRDISFQIKDGECVGLIGANGAGKSTILRLMLGLLEGTGRIRIGELAVEKKNLPEIRRQIGYVFQDSDNQMFMPTILEDMMFAPRNYGMSAEEAEKKVDEILTQMDLMKLKHAYNHKISGGEKRMAAIATVLVMDPAVVLMDEPSIALDPVNRRTVINRILDMKQTRLIASHDLDMILETCSRVILLSGGQIVADGPAEQILRDQKLLEANRMELPFCLAGWPGKREG